MCHQPVPRTHNQPQRNNSVDPQSVSPICPPKDYIIFISKQCQLEGCRSTSGPGSCWYGQLPLVRSSTPFAFRDDHRTVRVAAAANNKLARRVDQRRSPPVQDHNWLVASFQISCKSSCNRLQFKCHLFDAASSKKAFFKENWPLLLYELNLFANLKMDQFAKLCIFFLHHLILDLFAFCSLFNAIIGVII